MGLPSAWPFPAALGVTEIGMSLISPFGARFDLLQVRGPSRMKAAQQEKGLQDPSPSENPPVTSQD